MVRRAAKLHPGPITNEFIILRPSVYTYMKMRVTKRENVTVSQVRYTILITGYGSGNYLSVVDVVALFYHIMYHFPGPVFRLFHKYK